MKTKSILILIMLLIPTIALAEGKPYIFFNGGAGNLEGIDNGHALGGGGGIDFGVIRFEGEVLSTDNETDVVAGKTIPHPKHPGHFTVIPIHGPEDSRTIYFANTILDVPLFTDFELYVGAGYGFPEYQGMAGLRWNLGDWSLGLGYKFIQAPEQNGFQYTNHLVISNLSYYFQGW